MTSEFATLFKLDLSERLQLVEDLWDSIALEDAADLPVPNWKRDELRRRKERFLHQPETGRTWQDVEREARERVANG